MYLILSHFPVVNAQTNGTSLSDDFSNNLFTDLVPLLALFGEEVSKQFMSQAMGWLDDIIFAMCPLGIITAMVSAIRAGGAPALKALLGRAREPVGTIEIELLSSTSSEVCELYGEQGIVRVPSSSAKIEQWIYEEMDDKLTLYDIDLATDKGKWFEQQTKSRTAAYSEEKSVQGSEKSKRPALSGAQKRSPPSILLNYHSASGSPLELWMVAITGLVLQSVVLMYGALVTYQWEWTNEESIGKTAHERSQTCYSQLNWMWVVLFHKEDNNRRTAFCCDRPRYFWTGCPAKCCAYRPLRNRQPIPGTCRVRADYPIDQIGLRVAT